MPIRKDKIPDATMTMPARKPVPFLSAAFLPSAYDAPNMHEMPSKAMLDAVTLDALVGSNDAVSLMMIYFNNTPGENIRLDQSMNFMTLHVQHKTITAAQSIQ